LDILVNNAGISGSSVGDPDAVEGWHRIIAVNQTSVFLGTKLAAEQMAKTGGGSIVNISSIMGFVGSTSGHPAYRASKGAVRIYSKAAAVRYDPSEVRVNTVHPGYMPPMPLSGHIPVPRCGWAGSLRRRQRCPPQQVMSCITELSGSLGSTSP
jgi:NAD(P)-dependent dehydrogenase (short-subunit alcohol dehydrogenase family)